MKIIIIFTTGTSATCDCDDIYIYIILKFLWQVLLSRVYFFHGKDNTKLAKYQKSAQALMCTLLPESPSATSDRTNGKFVAHTIL